MKTKHIPNQLLTFQIYSATVKGTYISEDENEITVLVTEDFSGGVGKVRSIDKRFLINNK